MVDDFEIRVGIEPAGGGGTAGSKGSEGISFGFMKGLKMAGVVGILSQLKIVTDTVGIVLQLIQVGIVAIVGFLGGLFGLFLTKLVPFFDDPMTSLLRLGLFIVNGIITGLEFVINGILGIFGKDAIELPRFREDVLIDSLSGPGSFLDKLSNSLMTNAEYMDYVNEQTKSNQEITEQALDSGKTFAEIIKVGFEQTGYAFSPAFDAIGTVANTLISESNRVLSMLNSNKSFSQSAANLELGNIRKQSTTFSQKEAKSGLYLLNKLGSS